jgi:hypothetical protein
LIRSIRLLGAALGVVVGLTLATFEGGLFTGMQYSGAVLAAWTIAWLVAGFGVLPYLTVVPAGWVLRQGQQLSTAETAAEWAAISSNCFSPSRSQKMMLPTRPPEAAQAGL